MTAGWLLYDVLVVALCAAAAWAVEALCRQLGRPARWSWLAAAVAAAALIVRTALVANTPAVGVVIASAPSANAVLSAAPGWTPLSAMRDAIALSVAAIASMADGAARLLPSWIVTAAFMLWLGVSVATMLALLLVHRRIRRARRVWPEADLHGSRVRIAPDVGPAVVGMMRPEIVVPRWLLHCTPDEQRLVVAHESEHLRGRDHLLLGAGCFVVALMPWHPAAWWMLARLRLAIELDCDARVLRRGVPVRTYGAVLIDLAERCSGFQVGAIALADESSHLERRLLAMNAKRSRHPLLRATLLGAVAAAALLAACEAKVPTASQVDGMDAMSAERSATQIGMIEKVDDPRTQFFVNGVQVSAAEAHAIAPNRIATVNVTKVEAPTAGSAIRIVTRDAASALDGPRHDTTGAAHAMAPFNGLLLIDGVRADPARLKTLDPKSILSIDVIKGPSAAQLSSDPAAANGIIKVVTKSGAPNGGR
jgi:beta-lactamase regulating signal transducer with metallopeptidase domain